MSRLHSLRDDAALRAFYDLVGGHQGYLADQTRTFALGPLAGSAEARQFLVAEQA